MKRFVFINILFFVAALFCYSLASAAAAPCGINHAFVSAKAQGADATIVGPNEWNADHNCDANALGPTEIDETANYNFTGTIITTTTVASLGTATSGVFKVVTDGNPDCATGGGSAIMLCRGNGTSWNTIGPGDVTEVQGVSNETTVTSGTGPVPIVGISATPDLSGKVLQGGTPLVFEGATADAFETSLAVIDPTADRTVRIPDASGTLALKGDTLFSASDYNFSTTDPAAVTTVGVANPIYHRPILSNVTAGALALQNYSARITFTNATGETLPSLIAVLTVAANNQLKIRSPFEELWNALRTPTVSGIAGITIEYVRSNNGAGTGQMVYTSAGTTLTWKAPGSATAGTPVNIGAGGNFTVADGVDATKTVDVSVVAASLPGNTTVNPVLAANPAALNATGWNVYVATTVGTETKQNGGTPIVPSADFTVTSLVAGTALPTANTTGTTVVTPASFANSSGLTSFYAPVIVVGSGAQKATHFHPILIDDGGANEEVVLVESITATTFTAVFTKTHSAGYTIKSATKGIAEAVFAIEPLGGNNPDGGGTVLLPVGVSAIDAPIPLRDNTVYVGRGGTRFLGATASTTGQSQIRYTSTDTTKSALFAQGTIGTESTAGIILKNFFVNSDTHVVRVGGALGGTAGLTIEGVKFLANSIQTVGLRASAIRNYYGGTRIIIKESQFSGSPVIEVTGANIIGFAINDSWLDLQPGDPANGAGLVVTANSGAPGGIAGAALYMTDVVFEGGVKPILDLQDVDRLFAHNISNSDWTGAANEPSIKIRTTQGTANLIHISDSLFTTGASTVANIQFIQDAGSIIERVVIEGVDFDGNSPFVDAGSSQGPFIFRNNRHISIATSGNGSIQNPPSRGIVYCDNVKVASSSNLDPRCNLAPNLLTNTGLVQQYSGTTAQSYEVYGTFTDASNYKRLKMSHDGTSAVITVQGAGTGAGAAALNLTTQGGNINLSGGAVTTDTSGFFVNSLTASRCVATDGSKQLVSSAGTGGCATGGGTATGTNTGDQTITLTGDVTGSGTGSFATTLATVPVAKGGTGLTTAQAHEVYFEAATCNNVTATLAFNANTANVPAATCEGTNTRLATADFDDTTDEGFDGQWRLPTGFTGAIDVIMRGKAVAITGAVGICFQMVRVPTGATSDPALPAQAAANCVSFTIPGTTLQETEATITGVTCTSCVAGDRVNWKLTRDADGSAVTDSMTGDFSLLGFTRRWRVTPQS